MSRVPELSKPEFDILRILWQDHPLSVREVHDLIIKTHDWAYTTTKTMMDRMVKKNLLKRESIHRVFVYTPLVSRAQGLVSWVEFFAERVLEIEPDSVLRMLGQSKSLSLREIEELKSLLDGRK